MRLHGTAAAGAVLACCLLACLPLIDANIEHAYITRDERALVLVAQPFAFGSRGHATISLKNLALYRRHNQAEKGFNLKNLGFILSSSSSKADLQKQLQSSSCPLQDPKLQLFTFDHSEVQQVLMGQKEVFKFDVDIANGEVTFIHFINCEQGMPVSFAVMVEQYNYVGLDGHKDYLAIGESELDVMYWVMFSLFAALSVTWVTVLCRSDKQQVQYVHWLMLALVILKALTLLGQAAMYYVIEHQGTPHGWNWVYYLFTGLRGLLFFTVVILIGTGWSYMQTHAFIEERTRQVLLLVVPLQVVANIAIIITSEESPAFNSWLTWNDILHFADIVCCCAVLFPIVWNIHKLKEANQLDGKAARNLAKLQLLRSFYVMVVAFIWVSRIGVFMMENVIDYRYKWTAAALNELAVLTFYVVVGTQFRPGVKNPYFRLGSEDGA